MAARKASPLAAFVSALLLFGALFVGAILAMSAAACADGTPASPTTILDPPAYAEVRSPEEWNRIIDGLIDSIRPAGLDPCGGYLNSEEEAEVWSRCWRKMAFDSFVSNEKLPLRGGVTGVPSTWVDMSQDLASDLKVVNDCSRQEWVWNGTSCVPPAENISCAWGSQVWNGSSCEDRVGDLRPPCYELAGALIGPRKAIRKSSISALTVSPRSTDPPGSEDERLLNSRIVSVEWNRYGVIEPALKDATVGGVNVCTS